MENIVPRTRWLYSDRGMVKWMGWLLSDHSAYLAQQQVARQQHVVRPGMRLTVLEKLFQDAWTKGRAVTIQPDILAYGQYVAECQGTVVSLENGRLYLQSRQGQIQTIALNDIHGAALIPPEKWWDNDNPF